MARPRKPRHQLHSVRLDLWLTEQQVELLARISERRDIPKGIVGRDALLLGLNEYLRSLAQDQAA